MLGFSVSIYLIALSMVQPFGNFPLLDDWVYASAAVASGKARAFSFTGYESAWTLPQIALGAVLTEIFGLSHVLFRVVSVISLIGSFLMLNAYLYKRGIPFGIRTLMSSLLLFNPVVFLLSMTFMSDIPFLLLWLAACFAWDSALATKAKRWMMAAVLLTALAVSQRQFGILIPISVVLWIAWRGLFASSPSLLKGRDAILITGAVVLSFGLVWWTYVWRMARGGYQPPILWSSPWDYFIPNNLKMVFLLTLSLVPALLLVPFRPHAGRAWAAFGVGLSLLLCVGGAFFLSTGEPVLLGNLLSVYGIARTDELLLGNRPILFPPWMNAAALSVAVIMFFLTVPSLLRAGTVMVSNGPGNRTSVDVRPQSGETFGVVLIVSTGAYLAMFSIRGGFDRYLIPALPGLLVIAANAVTNPSPWRLRAAYGALVCMGALSVALSYDYFRWNEVKWQAATELVSSGVSSAKIHAGYEWHGWYHGDSSPFPGGLSSGYSHAISFSDSIDSFSVKAEKEWVGVFPPFRHKIFVLERVGGRLTASVP